MARLSLAQLEEYDSRAPYWHKRERRFACPTDECSDKRVDAAHRSLSANTETGAWYCHRCGQGGILAEFVKKSDADPWAIHTDEDMDRIYDAINEQVAMRDAAYKSERESAEQ